MGTKTIQGDLNITGSVTANGTNLSEAAAEGVRMYETNLSANALTTSVINTIINEKYGIVSCDGGDDRNWVVGYITNDEFTIFQFAGQELYAMKYGLVDGEWVLGHEYDYELDSFASKSYVTHHATKLYKHAIIAQNDNELFLVTTDASAYTHVQQIYDALHTLKAVRARGFSDNEGDAGEVTGFYYASADLELYIKIMLYDASNTITEFMIFNEAFTDTVTPL